jgi:hypothetical protein
MFDDTSLMRMVIEDLAKNHKWTYEETLDKFYDSKVCKGLSDKRTGMFTFAPREIIELFEQETGATQ